MLLYVVFTDSHRGPSVAARSMMKNTVYVYYTIYHIISLPSLFLFGPLLSAFAVIEYTFPTTGAVHLYSCILCNTISYRFLLFFCSAPSSQQHLQLQNIHFQQPVLFVTLYIYSQLTGSRPRQLNYFCLSGSLFFCRISSIFIKFSVGHAGAFFQSRCVYSLCHSYWSDPI